MSCLHLYPQLQTTNLTIHQLQPTLHTLANALLPWAGASKIAYLHLSCNFSIIAAPPVNTLLKEAAKKITWSATIDSAFQQLNRNLAQKTPIPKTPIHLWRWISKRQERGCAMKIQPISFFSHKRT